MRTVFFACLLALQGCGGDCLNPSGCNAPGAPAQGVTAPPADNLFSGVPEGSVLFRVDGTALRADVSYFGPSAIGDAKGAQLPFQLFLPAGSKQFYSLQAVNTGDTGSVRVTIASGGRVLNQASSNAPRGFTSVSAECC